MHAHATDNTTPPGAWHAASPPHNFDFACAWAAATIAATLSWSDAGGETSVKSWTASHFACRSSGVKLPGRYTPFVLSMRSLENHPPPASMTSALQPLLSWHIQ